MTVNKARELIRIQLGFGSGYNRHSVRLILGEVQREHGRDAVDALIHELDLEAIFDLPPGTDFSRVTG